MKLQVTCDFCGKSFQREAASLRGKRHHFCSRQCLADYSNKAKNPDNYLSLKDFTNMGRHLSELNRKLNPTRMTFATREKLRNARLDSGDRRSYRKRWGRHEHRIVAEEMLGCPLRPGEVVHHIDGNKRNNAMNNLMVFPSQAEHARFHMLEKRAHKGGDAK